MSSPTEALRAEEKLNEMAATYGVDPDKLRRVAEDLASVSAFSFEEAVRQVLIGLGERV